MFLKLVEEEIKNARKNHGPIKSFHEGLGILEEEFWEFKLEVFKKHADRKGMLEELVQVAAMCMKLAEDKGLLEQPNDYNGILGL